MNSYHKYLPCTDVEKRWGFYVTTVGYSKIEAKQKYPLSNEHPPNHAFTWNKGRILDGYYVVFISKGEGVFQSAETEATVIKEGTCFFLFPGVWHRYKPNINCGWEEYWVGFKGDYPEALMTKGFFSSDKPIVKTGFMEALAILFHKLIEAVRAGATGYHQVISGITLEILGLIHSLMIYDGEPEDPVSKIIAKAKFILRESSENALDMKKLTTELAVGYSKFRKLFKEKTGQSPHQYHLNLRLNRAKELLDSTTLNINEVADQTGFDSVFYFSRLFKEKNGVAPKHYRSIKKQNIVA
jgi:AraC-like DNA-binding protein